MLEEDSVLVSWYAMLCRGPALAALLDGAASVLERFSLRKVTSLALLYFILLAISAVSYDPTPGVWKEVEDALFTRIFLQSLGLL